MLTDTFIRQVVANPDKETKYADGQGLSLIVTKAGAKRFVLKYRFSGKEKSLSLGVYPAVTLKAAREAVQSAKQLLAKGLDPSAEKAKAKLESRRQQDNTFRACANEWHEGREGSVSEHTWQKERSILDTWLLPWLGRVPVNELDAPALLEAIRRVQKHSVETAGRALTVVKHVYKLAVVTGKATRNPAFDLQGVLPATKTKHYAAQIKPEQFGVLLSKIDNATASFPVACALRLLPLLFCRPGELREMRWAEIDFERSEWAYFVTKTEVEHLVPLSQQAVAILEELRPLTGHYDRVFTVRGGSPLSCNTLNGALRKLGIDTKTEQTGHGFRASARTMLAERLKVEPHIIEHQLSHAVPDALGRAYNRALYIDQRRKMMQEWADYCDSLKSAASEKSLQTSG